MEYSWTSLRFSQWALEVITVPPVVFLPVASVGPDPCQVGPV